MRKENLYNHWVPFNWTGGILLLLVLAAFSGSCDRSSRNEKKQDPENFDAYIRETGPRMCERMHTCYGKLIRTLSEESRKKVQKEACLQAFSRDLEKKLAVHTPAMKLLSRECYGKILEAPCDRIAEVAFWSPACLRLRSLSADVYTGDFIRDGGTDR